MTSPDTEEMPHDGHILDAEGGLAIPPFIEPHVHLDTTLTAGQPRWNESGTLFEGIERWAERKQLLSPQDVAERALTALKWQAAQGIQYVRTHVDITDPSLTALKTMLDFDGPYLLEVMVGKENNVFPMVAQGSSVSEIRLK